MRGRQAMLPVGRTKRLLAVDVGAERGEFMLTERLIHPQRFVI